MIYNFNKKGNIYKIFEDNMSLIYKMIDGDFIRTFRSRNGKL